MAETRYYLRETMQTARGGVIADCELLMKTRLVGEIVKTKSPRTLLSRRTELLRTIGSCCDDRVEVSRSHPKHSNSMNTHPLDAPYQSQKSYVLVGTAH